MGDKGRGLHRRATRWVFARKPSGISRGFVADFFGASPVASALDVRFGRYPDSDSFGLQKGKTPGAFGYFFI